MDATTFFHTSACITLVASRKYAKSCLCAHLIMFLCKNLTEGAHAQRSTPAGTFFRVESKLDTAAVKLVIFSASCKSVLLFFYLTGYGSICHFFFLCLLDSLYMKMILWLPVLRNSHHIQIIRLFLFNFFWLFLKPSVKSRGVCLQLSCFWFPPPPSLSLIFFSARHRIVFKNLWFSSP